ncbi:hypothetical protein EC988_009675, partial [Linderina pennispora]
MQSSSSQRARAMHMLQSTSPISPLMGHMLKPRRRSSATQALDEAESSGSSMRIVLAKRERDRGFMPVNINGLISGAGIVEKIVSSLYADTSHVPPPPPPPGGWSMSLQMSDGSVKRIGSEGELWMHCVHAKTDTPVVVILNDPVADEAGALYKASSSGAEHHIIPASKAGSKQRLVLAVTGGERSSSGSDSEVQSAFPFNRTPFMQSPV